MRSQSGGRPGSGWRWYRAGVIVIALFTLYPIALSVRSGNWLSMVLLLVLDAAMIGTWIVGERKRAMGQGEAGASSGADR
jgi:hypothetical protein